MNIQTFRENSFFDSLEVKIFVRISSELMLLEKVLEINKSSANNGVSEGALLEQISAIWSILNNLIVNEKKEAEHNLSQNELKSIIEVIFVLVSMIDEFFMRKEKAIADFWNKNLLEFQYFNTRSSGNTFFDKLDVAFQNPADKNKSVLFVYLLSLNMGFKGKFFGVEKEKEIIFYKRSLYSIIFNKNAYLVNNELGSYLSNNFVLENQDAFNGVRLANNRFIYYMTFILMIIYILSTYFVFYRKEFTLNEVYKNLNNSLEFIEK